MLPKRNDLILILFIFMASSGLAAGSDNGACVFAQADSESKTGPIDSASTVDIVEDKATDSLADSSEVSNSIVEDTVVIEPNLESFGSDSILINAYAVEPVDSISRQSPSTALLKSMIFPGWGQYSNGKYIKAAVILGLESYFIYRAVDLHRKASDWKDRWREAPDYLKSEYFSTYTDYRDRRNSFYWYTAITIFLSMFDAYVDAHLAPFPDRIRKPEDVSLEMESGARPSVRLVYYF